MAKLVEILAREYTVWPSRCFTVEQSAGGMLWEADFKFNRIARVEVAEDYESAVVTRTQWEAERKRIVEEIGRKSMQEFNQRKTTETKAMSSEDQELWESVAKQSFSDFNRKTITHDYGDFQKNARSAFNAADAFMEERTKHLKGE